MPTAGAGPLQFDEALAVARRLAGVIVAPSDCGSVPPEDPFLLPNAARAYRSGVHRGVDYMCAEHGRVAVAALDGRVVVAVGDYETPSPSQRDTLLAIAAQRGATPPFTLLMLYGNYVVVDHGHVDDVGHVVTIYAHLASLTAGISTGTAVRAGDELGRIGNTGTEHDAAGAADRGVHLHWEIHINDHHLAAGLSLAETRTIYTTLFNNPTNT